MPSYEAVVQGQLPTQSATPLSTAAGPPGRLGTWSRKEEAVVFPDPSVTVK